MSIEVTAEQWRQMREIVDERDRLKHQNDARLGVLQAMTAERDALRAENERLRAMLGEAAIFIAGVAHGPCAGADNVKAWGVTMKEAARLMERLKEADHD